MNTTSVQIKFFLSCIKNIVLLSGFLGVIFFSCQPKLKSVNDEKHEIRVKVEAVQFGDGWGFQILQNEQVYIDQPFIPCIQGYHRFQNQEDALKTGRLLLKKMRDKKHVDVTIRELDSMQIKYPH